MALMANNDRYVSKPKFDKERLQEGLVTLSLANTSTFPNAIIRVVSAGNVANGWVANAVNLGNTFGTQGFNLIGPYVLNVSGNTIFLSQAPGNTLAVGSTITFSNPIVLANTFRSNTWANTYNANTYAVSATRMANANSLVNQIASIWTGRPLSSNESSAVAHQGWVWAKPQTGYIRAGTVVVGGNGYANGTVTLTGNTQYPGGSGGAVTYTVGPNGVIVLLTVTAPGANYFLTPAATIPQVNGANHFYIGSIVVTAPGTNYVNGFLNVSSTTVGSGANVAYNTYSANGGINNNSLVINLTGGGFDGNNQNLTVTGSNGTGATFTVTELPGANATVTIQMGGRANRILTEVLATANSMGITDATSGGLFFPGS